VGNLRDRLGAYYVDLMGSGYNVVAIPSCWYALMTGTLGTTTEIEGETLPRKVDDEKRLRAARSVSRQLREVLSPFWKDL
jgi:acetoin utilization deacetylase AcuC-like enzyme